MIVVKVGGSLFDLPNLGFLLKRWLDELDSSEVLLVPGGGHSADMIRQMDRIHGLGEEKAHWLALRSLSFQAHLLAEILVDAVVVRGLHECRAAWDAGRRPILDGHAFAVADESLPGRLPHSWNATSDALAARVARVAAASRLVLLKSVTIPEGTSWVEASRLGWVDAYFAEAVDDALPVQCVNFMDRMFPPGP